MMCSTLKWRRIETVVGISGGEGKDGADFRTVFSCWSAVNNGSFS